MSLLASLGTGAASTPPDDAVRIEGVVTYDGRRPAPVPVIESVTVRELIEVDPGTGGLKDAVVWLEGVPDQSAPDRADAEGPVVMDQVNFFFVPHVLAVRSGQPVEFRNSDPANHGITTSSSEHRDRLNVTTPPGAVVTHRFVAAKQPVAVGCPVHAAMGGWVYVFGHPFYAVTDGMGRFMLPPVLPGRYRLHVHHADGGMERDREVVVGPDGPLRLRIELHDADRRTSR
jgi:plastocyanin